MKTVLKISILLLFVGVVSNSFAQQKADQPQKTSATKKAKSHKKGAKAIDNKIAVSDQAKPSDKKNTKAAKKDKGISNK